MKFIINLYQGYFHNLGRNLKTKILPVILSLITCFSLGIVATAEFVTLSLSQALDIIESENLQVLIQRQAVEETLQRSFVERSKLLPSVNLESFQLLLLLLTVHRVGVLQIGPALVPLVQRKWLLLNQLALFQ